MSALRFSQLETIIKSQFAMPGGNKVNFMILGEPGGGKTELARKIGRDMGFDNVLEFNASLRDPVDLLGTPNNNGDVTRWVKPADLATLERGRNLLIVEEITDCNLMMQNALCRLTYDREVGELKLSKETFVIATGNRSEDKSGANRLSTKLSNRFSIHEFQSNLDDWVEWALKSKAEGGGEIDPVLIQFLRFKPGQLHDFKPDAKYGVSATPRAWEAVNRVDTNLSSDLYYASVSGKVGDGAAAEYTAFRKIYAGLISFEEICMHPTKVKVPEDLGTLYAIVGSISHHTKVDNVERVAQFVDRLPSDFSVMYWMDTMKREPKVKTTKPFIKWATNSANVVLS